VSTVLSAFTRMLNLGELAVVGLVVHFIVAVTGSTLLFAALFKFLPDIHIRWKEALVGAVLTSILFNVGQILIGQYLGRSSVGSAYGAAGSLVVLLVWIDYSAAIFFFGAEVTQAYASRSSWESN
jgi:membrane protein